MAARLDILYEDNHLLVLNKPAGLATMGVTPDRPCLVEAVKHDLKVRYHKPGNVYVGIVSRLDASASGAIVMAKTSKAAARLTDQFKSREVEKRYWAITSGNPPGHHECEDWLRHEDRQEKVLVCRADAREAQLARLSFRRLQTIGRGSLLEIELETGRKHQIRVQLAARDWPIWGDRKYGSHDPFPVGIALHSRRLAFTHPTRDTRLEFIAPTPSHWQRLGVPA